MSPQCQSVQQDFLEYLDGSLNGAGRQALARHTAACTRCRTELENLRSTSRLVAGLGRKQAPPDLALRLRIALSQERARNARPWLQPVLVHWQNAARAFMIPATAGLMSAVLFFGLLIGFMAVPQLSGEDEVPSSLFTPAELMMAPDEATIGGPLNTDSIVVDALVDSHGRVQDYRIISGAADAQKYGSQLDNKLIFTTFRPATAFGQPTSSRVLLSFSKVNVKG